MPVPREENSGLFRPFVHRTLNFFLFFFFAHFPPDSRGMKYARIQFTSCPNHILTTVTAKTENQQKQRKAPKNKKKMW